MATDMNARPDIRARRRSVARAVLSHVRRENRDRILRVNPDRAHRPWMRYREIDLVEELIRTLAPASCLEWGAGYSTLHFPTLLGAGARWLTVEHDREWAERITGLNRSPAVEVVCVPPSCDRWTDPHEDGSRAELAGYVDFPEDRGPFDLIVVDGRARVACIEKAAGLLADGGVVMLHDANRVFYHGPFGLYPHRALFTTRRFERKQQGGGGIFLGALTRPIEEVVDVAGHLKVWRVCALLDRAIRC